jgi:hypothetical protein
MEAADQFAIGFAVGQRGGPGGTFNVYGGGIRPAAQSSDLAAWPKGYRRGVAKGLMTDRNCYIVIGTSTLDDVLAVIAPIPKAERAAVVTELRDGVVGSEFAYAVDEENRTAAAAAARRAGADATGDLATALEELADEISLPEEVV